MKYLTIYLVLLSSYANADYAFPIEGDYSGRGEGELSMKTIILDNEKGIVAVSAFTGIPNGCSGTIAGIGKFVGDTLTFNSYTKEEGSENCVVQVNFDKNRKSGKISEQNCSAFHGAACAFDGKLIKKRQK
jgi:hypothetical protein